MFFLFLMLGLEFNGMLWKTSSVSRIAFILILPSLFRYTYRWHFKNGRANTAWIIRRCFSTSSRVCSKCRRWRGVYILLGFFADYASDNCVSSKNFRYFLKSLAHMVIFKLGRNRAISTKYLWRFRTQKAYRMWMS